VGFNKVLAELVPENQNWFYAVPSYKTYQPQTQMRAPAAL
jgi:hypothetical protein